MPALVLFSGVAVVFAYRNRKWLYDSLDEPVWRACLLGSLSLSMIGSLFNDSGPLLFIIGVFALGTITAYIQGDPALAADADRLAPVEPTKLGDALADDTTDRAPEPALASLRRRGVDMTRIALLSPVLVDLPRRRHAPHRGAGRAAAGLGPRGPGALAV